MKFRLLLVLMMGLSGFEAAAKETLTVLTAYPEEVVALFETAFERDNPDIDLKVLWRRHDALPYLRMPAQGGVDVYWSAALHNFLQLKQEGAWQKLAIDRTGLADNIGALPLIDPDGYYCATEIAGFGFAVNPGYLRKHGLPLPKSWQDLTDARYSGHIALPVPSKRGNFVPLMIDSILQQYGWESGWALLAEIAANAQLLPPGPAFITDIIGSGERGIAPSIDFFAASAQANGAPLQMIYPESVAYSPAHIAIAAATQHAKAARRFVNFMLSETGQKLLFHPDVRKLPVRAAVYADKPEGYFDPFKAAVSHPPVYDRNVTLQRLALDNALFELLLTEHHETAQRLWQQLRRLEAQDGGKADRRIAHIRRLLTAVPIDGKKAQDLKTQQIFMKHTRANDADAEIQANKLEQAWRAEIGDRYKEAERLLAQWER
ncbi:ABC transporter substrate-binding protein [Methylobacter luteus]|uniref:ABC transporter substrate-binding protein n=1 Tax=Methylobacter luteus TaxID=415 RepID=UPI0003FBB8C5|nr:extracellular solute-binding protein [Methylobacter luteus]